MKKRISTLLLVLCMALALMVPALAANVQYNAGNGVTMEVPSRYLVFTPEQPVQTLSDGTKLDYSSDFNTGNTDNPITLIALDQESGALIVVSTTAVTPSSSTTTMDEIIESESFYRQTYGNDMLDYALFTTPNGLNCSKMVIRDSSSGSTYYFLSFLSVYQGRSVAIALQCDSDVTLAGLSNEVEQVVNSVKVAKNGEAAPTPTTQPTVQPTVQPTAQPDPQTGFNDVAKSAYYYDAVNWAVGKGVTNGTGANTFSPENPCTRAQVVTFLWRANGSPKVSGNNPFTDVAAGSYYYDAVLWAVSKGVTTGTSDTTFSPGNACTRGQVVTFLWRANNKPAAAGGSGFSDVPADQYYHTAVLWAVGKQITNGTGNGLFSPDQTCTRGQIVTFLYRALK